MSRIPVTILGATGVVGQRFVRRLKDHPSFEIRHLADSHGLVELSANFTLNGDMSVRMMTLATGPGPTQEIYSIDESFIGLDGVRCNLIKRALDVRAHINQ